MFANSPKLYPDHASSPPCLAEAATQRQAGEDDEGLSRDRTDLEHFQKILIDSHNIDIHKFANNVFTSII